MPIPQEFINDLIERADLAELIAGHIKLQRRGANLVGLCPFHQEKTPSFTVQPAKGFYHCFGCGAHGDAIAFLQQQYGMDFFAAVDKLATMQGVKVPQQAGGSGGGGSAQRMQTGELLTAAMQYFQQQLRQSDSAKAYLKNRGVTGETAAHYKIGYARDEWDGLKQALASKSDLLLKAGLVRKKDEKTYDYFRNRIIFPIIDSSERVCGFGGRALNEEDPPKYLNSAESGYFSKRRLLFGLPQAMKAAQQKKRLILCEGYMDVVMLAQAGFAEAAATMGTAATAEQMKKAARLAPNLYLAYDGDAAGQKGAFRAMQGILTALKDGISVFFLFLPAGHDPDSFTRANGADAFEQLLASAKPLGDYLVEALWQQADAASPEGRATGVMKEGGQLLQLLSDREAPAWRSLLEKKLEQQTGIAMAAVLKAAAKPRAHAQPQTAFRMPPQSLLYNLLCCLSIKPVLAERLPLNLPLPGGAQEVEVVSAVLKKLRLNRHDSDNDSMDVLAILEEGGNQRLAQQVRHSIAGRFARTKNIDIEAELQAIIDKLQGRHKKLARAGKREWLEKLRADSTEASAD